MGVCDWWSKRKFDKALKRGTKAADEYNITATSILNKRREAEYYNGVLNEGLRDICRKAMAESFKPYEPPPKPDTVESVLNQFIALGHDKPEVVIKGTKYADGVEFYYVKIDGQQLTRTYSLEDAELWLVIELNRMKGKLAVEEIEITY